MAEGSGDCSGMIVTCRQRQSVLAMQEHNARFKKKLISQLACEPSDAKNTSLQIKQRALCGSQLAQGARQDLWARVCDVWVPSQLSLRGCRSKKQDGQ